MTEPAIQLSALGKRYVQYRDTPTLVSAARGLGRRTRRGTLWAVRGVDLVVEPGLALGVIGRNGSGKSTLLQLLCGVTGPTEGRLRVRGRIAPLIAVGVGFHPELTGRENVFINGSILGLTRPEIARRFDEIVAFAEIENFIDTPVKFYSSGMFVRLGFSVAVCVDPDVLLIDEVLAVGDLGFQMKCVDRMRQARDRGATVVLVSHNLNAVRNMCDRVVVLESGRQVFDGAPAEAVSAFHRLIAENRDPEGSEMSWGGRAVGGRAAIGNVELIDADGKPTTIVASDAEVTIRLRVRALQPIERPFLGLYVGAENGTRVYSDSGYEHPMPALAAGEERECRIRFRPTLVTGTYSFQVSLADRKERSGETVQLAVGPQILAFVTGRSLASGVADLRAEFDDVSTE
ncbi:MAG TPA: ABC transporter ATP-binding protein [Mycobacteriales bacterium]|nr:ABC transporter ATP-binding protein [Mycobacteriales bacterium]